MMRSIRRGTTPCIYVKTNADFSDCDYFEFTITSNETSITHSGDEILYTDREDGYYIYTRLTQEETLRFRSGTQSRVQFRAIKDGNAIASTIDVISVEEILHDGVIGGE